MSQHHQVAMVQVNAFQHETVQLAEVMGRVPVTEIVEVLESQWGRDNGWHSVGAGAYERVLVHGIAMRFEIDAEGEVALKRRGSAYVEQSVGAARHAELERLIAEVEPEYNLQFNHVLSRALLLALPRQAEELGFGIVDTTEEYEPNSVTYDLELKLQVHELALV
jgi:hypothetical protein